LLRDHPSLLRLGGVPERSVGIVIGSVLLGCWTSTATSHSPSLDFHSAGKQLTLMVDDGLGLGKLDDEFFPGEPMHRSRRVGQSRRDKVRIVSAFVE